MKANWRNVSNPALSLSAYGFRFTDTMNSREMLFTPQPMRIIAMSLSSERFFKAVNFGFEGVDSAALTADGGSDTFGDAVEASEPFDEERGILMRYASGTRCGK